MLWRRLGLLVLFWLAASGCVGEVAQGGARECSPPCAELRPVAPRGPVGTPITLGPGADLQAALQAAEPGAVFVLRPGTYRVGGLTPKDGQVIQGEEGAVLVGSVPLTDWKADGARWRAPLPAPPLPRSGEMEPGRKLGAYREDLFVDDVLYQPVGSPAVLRPGTWFRDLGAGQAVIAINPTGRRIEIGKEPVAISGSANGVVLRNIVVEKYASDAQQGAIHGHEGRNWTLDGVVARWNHGSGINVGEGFVVTGGRVYENGQLGIGGGAAHGATIRGVEIFGNNYAGYSAYWEAGGVKIAVSRGVSMLNNYVHHNNGVGLWGDIDMVDTTYAGNLVVENMHSGIMHEISYRAVIKDNVLLRNGQANRNNLVPAQILVQNSQDVQVRDNYVEVGRRFGNGIAMTYEDRGSGVLGPYDTKNNLVADNTIVHLDVGGVNGFGTNVNRKVAMAWENTWRGNRYIVPDGAAVYWDLGGAKRNWKQLLPRWEVGGTLLVQQRSPMPDPGAPVTPPR